ncbi:MAG: hypothetical protein WD771_02655 [Gemmatimonadaceae bacterium]
MRSGRLIGICAWRVSDPGQSLLVYAGTMGISFNANLLAADTTDPGALEIEDGAATTLTEAWRVADAAAIPLTTVIYPTEDYTDANGALSRIETISYFLHPDTVSDRNDLYVLYRRVNARDSVQLVRGIHVPADSAFFSYLRMESGVLTAIAAASLPLYWDTTAMSDIRAVGLRSAGFFRNRQTGEDVIRTVYWTVVLANRNESGRDCGAAPAQPVAAQFSISVVDNAQPYRVELEWDDSPDDASGDGDVVYYLVEMKPAAAATWTLIGTVPATRASSYLWSHPHPVPTGSYNFGIRAVDCGGAVSTRAVKAASVALP